MIFWEARFTLQGHLRKDIFGLGGSEIPRPCIRRPAVATKAHSGWRIIQQRTTGDYPDDTGSTSIGLPLYSFLHLLGYILQNWSRNHEVDMLMVEMMHNI